jgi:hypothetical protein
MLYLDQSRNGRRNHAVWIRVVVALVLIIGVTVCLLASLTTAPPDTELAVYDAEAILRAYRAYSAKSGGQYPGRLADLVNPPWGGQALIVHPNRDPLIDPWGNSYKYALVPNENGQLEPQVWAERTNNVTITLHGARLSADGTTVQFGLR